MRNNIDSDCLWVSRKQVAQNPLIRSTLPGYTAPVTTAQQNEAAMHNFISHVSANENRSRIEAKGGGGACDSSVGAVVVSLWLPLLAVVVSSVTSSAFSRCFIASPLIPFDGTEAPSFIVEECSFEQSGILRC